LADHVARMGEIRKTQRILVGKTEGTGAIRRRNRKWDDNIKRDIEEM